MVPFFLFVVNRLPLAFGIFGVWFAVERWFWFQTLPRHAPARFCGNCFLAAVGVPTELGLLGLIVLGASSLKIPKNDRSLICWCCAAVGILLTPAVIGVPVFAFAFLVLIFPIVVVIFDGAVSVVFRVARL
jgi:hypothetical protein